MNYRYLFLLTVISGSLHGMTPLVPLIKKIASSTPARVAVKFVIPWQIKRVYSIGCFFHKRFFQDGLQGSDEKAQKLSLWQEYLSQIMNVDDPIYQEYVTQLISGQREELLQKCEELKRRVKANPFRPFLYERCQINTLEYLCDQKIGKLLASIMNDTLSNAEYAYQTVKDLYEKGELSQEEVDVADYIMNARINYEDVAVQNRSELGISHNTAPDPNLVKQQVENMGIPSEVTTYQDVTNIKSKLSRTARLDQRLKAAEELKTGIVHYSSVKYTLTSTVKKSLSEASCDPDLYTHCCGDLLQQALHKECNALIECGAALDKKSPLYFQKNAFIKVITLACKYTHIGFLQDAIAIIDFCWALLDYAGAIVKGVVNKTLDLINIGTHARISLPSSSRFIKNVEKLSSGRVNDVAKLPDHQVVITCQSEDSFDTIWAFKFGNGPWLKCSQNCINMIMNRDSLDSRSIDEARPYYYEVKSIDGVIRYDVEAITRSVYDEYNKSKKSGLPPGITAVPNKPVRRNVQSPKEVALRVSNDYHGLAHGVAPVSREQLKHIERREKSALMGLVAIGNKKQIQIQIDQYELEGFSDLAQFARELYHSELLKVQDVIANGPSLKTAVQLVDQLKKNFIQEQQKQLEGQSNKELLALNEIENQHLEDPKRKLNGAFNEYYNEYYAGQANLHKRKDYQEAMYYIAHPEKIPENKEWLKSHPEHWGFILKDLLRRSDVELKPIAQAIVHSFEQQKIDPQTLTDSQRAILQKETRIKFGSQAMEHFAENAIPAYYKLIELYQKQGFGDPARYKKYIRAYEETLKNNSYSTKQYQISDIVAQQIKDPNVHEMYTSFYGAPLQHAVHQESINLIEKLAGLSHESAVYKLRPELLELLHVACEYNQQGLTHKSAAIINFCSTLLEYSCYAGKATMSTISNVILYAGKQSMKDPLGTVLSIVNPTVFLIYQGSNIVANAGTVGLVILVDKKKGLELLDEYYIQPVKNLNEALKKIPPGEIVSLALEVASLVTATRFDMAWGRLCEAAEANKSEPSGVAQPSVVTPEGVTVEPPSNSNIFKKEIDGVKGKGSGVKEIPKVANMKEFFTQTEFGKSVSKQATKLNFTYKGAKVYKLNVEINDFMKKGYHFYLDTLHYDHLEVFNKYGKVKFVLNLDGTLNKAKTAVAIRDARSIPL